MIVHYFPIYLDRSVAKNPEWQVWDLSHTQVASVFDGGFNSDDDAEYLANLFSKADELLDFVRLVIDARDGFIYNQTLGLNDHRECLNYLFHKCESFISKMPEVIKKRIVKE